MLFFTFSFKKLIANLQIKRKYCGRPCQIMFYIGRFLRYEFYLLCCKIPLLFQYYLAIYRQMCSFFRQCHQDNLLFHRILVVRSRNSLHYCMLLSDKYLELKFRKERYFSAFKQMFLF